MRTIFIIFVAGLLSCPPAKAQTDEGCLDCHADRDLTSEDAAGREVSLFVDQNTLNASVHADFACTDCHADILGEAHEETPGKVECGQCHDEAAEDLDASVHGKELHARSEDAPACTTCHGTHNVLPVSDPASPVSKLNQPHTCAQCHANPEVIARNQFALKNPVGLYEKSIHGTLALQGNMDVATCSDCHTGHLPLYALDPTSTIHKLNIEHTCGKCHEKELAAYEISVHAKVLHEGAKDAPACIDCHHEHDIMRPANPEAPTSGFNVAVEVCSPCHASEKFAAKFGFATDRVKSYQGSYHGLALRGGKAAVANCGSCHGVHDILPSSDPRSHVHPANLRATCGRCHPNATDNFTKGAIHLLKGESDAKIVKLIRRIYIAIIIATIGFMIAHNVIDFLAKVRKIRAERYHAASR